MRGESLRGGGSGLWGELDRDDLRDARLLHGHAVERVRHFHRALVVRDHDELRAAAHLADHLVVPADVRLVERGVHFVEEAERSRFDQEDGEDERDRGQGLLSAGEAVHRRELLARRWRHDLHARLRRRVRRILDELQLRLAAAEEAGEYLLEAVVDELKGLAEALLRCPTDPRDRRPQLGDGLLQIRLLGGEEGEALADFPCLVDGGERHLAERVDLLAQRVHLLFGDAHVQLQRGIFLRRGDVGQLHQVPFADLLLEVIDLEQRTLQRQLRLAAAPGARALPRPGPMGLQRAQPRLSLALLALAGGDGLARNLLLAGHLAHRRLEVLGLVPEHLVALGDAAEVLLQPRDVALEAKVGEFLFALLVKQPLDLRVGGLDARTELLHSLGRQLQPRLELLHRVRQLLHFAPLVQQSIPDALERAAGNDALLVDHLAVGGDEGPLTRVPRPQREGRRQRLAEEDVREQVVAHPLVLRGAGHHVDSAHRIFRRRQRGGLRNQRELLHLGERNEGSAPLCGLAQIVHRLEAGGVALDQHELQPLSQHRLDGALVAPLHPQDVGDEPVDAVPAPLLLGAQHDRLHAAPVSLEVLLQLEQRGEAAAPVGQLLAELDELRLALALLGASGGEIRLGGDLVLVQLAALRLRLRQLLRQLVALARELLRARLQLLLLRRRLLQSPAELGAALLQVDEIRAVVGQSREAGHRLVPLAFHRLVPRVDFLERPPQTPVGLLLARLVLGGGIGQLLLLQAQPLLFSPEQLEAHSEERDLLLVLRLAGSDGLPLPLGELHLLLGEAELLVDGVGLIG